MEKLFALTPAPLLPKTLVEFMASDIGRIAMEQLDAASTCVVLAVGNFGSKHRSVSLHGDGFRLSITTLAYSELLSAKEALTEIRNCDEDITEEVLVQRIISELRDLLGIFAR